MKALIYKTLWVLIVFLVGLYAGFRVFIWRGPPLVGLELFDGGQAYITPKDVRSVIQLPADEDNLARTRIEFDGYFRVIIVKPSVPEVIEKLGKH